MLHTNVIEKSGFRTLRPTELEAVSGGYYDEPLSDEYIQFRMMLQELSPMQQSDLLSEINTSILGDGEYNSNTNEIVVSATPTDYDGSWSGTFYAILNEANKTYVQYDYIKTGLFSGYWVVVGHGTYTVTMAGETATVGTSFTVSSPTRSYAFSGAGTP